MSFVATDELLGIASRIRASPSARNERLAMLQTPFGSR